MSAMPCDFEAYVDTIVAKPVPFATVYVTLTKQAHIELVMQAAYWKSCHRRATLRQQWTELEQRRALDQAALREAALRSELEAAQATIRDLQQRVFGRKSERSKGANESQPSVSVRPRGHQRGKPGHGRKMHAHLPARVETVELVGAACPKCGLGLSEFPGTEDSEVVELEVKAYRRVIRHRWYLWVFHSNAVVHYVLNASRSAAVIDAELAGVEHGIISCDRYSAYKKFARLHPGVVLAFCWAHVRRDLLELANSYPDLSAWAFAGVDAIGALYHLNGLRLQAPEGSPQRATHHTQLEQAVQDMAQRRTLVLADPLLLAAPAAKVLHSMAAHWDGLTVFVDHPWVPMDNNAAESDMRGPVVGRKNFYGSASQWSGQLAATMYSLMMTLRLWTINARTWLGAYLQARVWTMATTRQRTSTHFCPGPWTKPGLRPCGLAP